jgi:hypothetical protein
MAEDVENGSPRDEASEVSSDDEGEMSESEIDHNVMGSFPASDPPSWTLGVSPHKKSRSEFDDDEAPSADEPSHQNEPDPSA